MWTGLRDGLPARAGSGKAVHRRIVSLATSSYVRSDLHVPSLLSFYRLLGGLDPNSLSPHPEDNSSGLKGTLLNLSIVIQALDQIHGRWINQGFNGLNHFCFFFRFTVMNENALDAFRRLGRVQNALNTHRLHESCLHPDRIHGAAVARQNTCGDGERISAQSIEWRRHF